MQSTLIIKNSQKMNEVIINNRAEMRRVEMAAGLE